MNGRCAPGAARKSACHSHEAVPAEAGAVDRARLRARQSGARPSTLRYQSAERSRSGQFTFTCMRRSSAGAPGCSMNSIAGAVGVARAEEAHRQPARVDRAHPTGADEARHARGHEPRVTARRRPACDEAEPEQAELVRARRRAGRRAAAAATRAGRRAGPSGPRSSWSRCASHCTRPGSPKPAPSCGTGFVCESGVSPTRSR